jgi:hypothetical protein
MSETSASFTPRLRPGQRLRTCSPEMTSIAVRYTAGEVKDRG